MPSCPFFLSRDIDSRLNYREAFAVKEFMDSGADIHGMLDSPNHAALLAGMFGGRRNSTFFSQGAFGTMIDDWLEANPSTARRYSADQNFLLEMVWNHVLEAKDSPQLVMHSRIPDLASCHALKQQCRPFPHADRDTVYTEFWASFDSFTMHYDQCNVIDWAAPLAREYPTLTGAIRQVQDIRAAML